MYITRFAVDGLAGRDGTVAFELNRNANIFWGLNGTGKTSLLKILHSALSNDADMLARVPVSAARVEMYSPQFNTEIVRTFSRDNEREQLDFDFAHNEFANFKTVEDGIYYGSTAPPSGWDTIITGDADYPPGLFFEPFSHQYLPISRVADSRSGPRRRSTAREVVDDALFDALFAEHVRRRWQVYNSEALASIRQIQQQGLAEILSVLFGGSNRAPRGTAPAEVSKAFQLVSSFLRRQGIEVNFNAKSFGQRYKQSELQDIVGRIQAVTELVDRTLEPQLNFSTLINELYSGDKRLSYGPRGPVVTISGKEVPLESLSSGEKQLMQILLETLSGGDDPVIIDEPELSMHVDWQNRLVQSMQVVNPECQLILATHSPEVMAEVELESIHQL